MKPSFLLPARVNRQLDRPPRKRGKQIHARSTGKDQVPVLVVRDRSGATADFKLTTIDKKTIELPLQAILAKDAIFCRMALPSIGLRLISLGITHRPVNLAASVYHIQNVNACDSRLKQWMGRFHGIATKCTWKII